MRLLGLAAGLRDIVNGLEGGDLVDEICTATAIETLISSTYRR